MILIIVLVLVLAVVFILQFVGNSKQSTYAQFKEDLDAGNIQAVYFNTGYSVNVVKRNTEAASRNNAAKYYDYFFYIGPNMHPVIYELITESTVCLRARRRFKSVSTIPCRRVFGTICPRCSPLY